MAWSRTSRQSRGYGRAWELLRETILRRDCGLCQCSECQGGKLRVRLATEVDHIVSKAAWQRLHGSQDGVDDPSNLAAINHDCHVRKTTQERGHTPRPQIGLDGLPIDASGGGGSET